MMNIFEKLFEGRVNPSQLKRVDTPESDKLMEEISQSMEMFEKRLSKSEFSELECMYSTLHEYLEMEYPRYFEHGFKLAITLQGAAAFNNWEFEEVDREEKEIG